MKSLLLVLLFISSGVKAQNQMPEAIFKEKYDSILNRTMPIKDGSIFYDTILAVQGSKEDLFSRVKRWELNSFKTANNPFATEDKEEGFFSVITRVKNPYKNYYVMAKNDSSMIILEVKFKIRVYTKDNKVRFIAADFTSDDMHVNDQFLESNLLNEIFNLDKYGTKKKYQNIDKNNQLAAISDFFNRLNSKLKLIIQDFALEINSNEANF